LSSTERPKGYWYFINNLGWGVTNITEGLANHLPYDLLYGSDVDSDFEVYSELLFLKI
jgi:hypothetical protein